MKISTTKIREIRLERKLKQTDVSHYLGLTKGCWNNYECGRRQIKADMLYEIAQLFGVPMDLFFED